MEEKMIKTILKTLSYVDWSFLYPFISTFPLGAIFGYKLAIRVKKKELTMKVIDEIREETGEYFSSMMEYHNGLDHFEKYPDELKCKIEKIIIRNSNKINFFKIIKIRNAINKITKLVQIILNDKNHTYDKYNIEDKYFKLYYKYLNSIGYYE
jgi:hypothetical protein